MSCAIGHLIPKIEYVCDHFGPFTGVLQTIAATTPSHPQNKVLSHFKLAGSSDFDPPIAQLPIAVVYRTMFLQQRTPYGATTEPKLLPN